MPIRITILGSTGSIGRSALDVVRHCPDRFEIVGLGCHSNVELLAKQAAEFHPKYLAITGPNFQPSSLTVSPPHSLTALWTGHGAAENLASVPADVVLCAMVGAAGLRPLLAAIKAGNRVALANKEALVMAGRLVMERARAAGVKVIPVDSEHNAVFQCLQGHRVEDVHRIHLTASGGPFYGRPRESLRDVGPDEAVKHPTWDMGAKISVDSATLMNKGLEVIEAMWLFGVPLAKIGIVIHPQSIVHSLVEFNDGSILAHLGVTDMRFPILFALAWPERVQSPMGRLDLAAASGLTFAAPDFSEFPCLAHALRAAEAGGTAPAVLNAANETAVAAFCKRRIAFLQIEEVVRRVLDDSEAGYDLSLEAIEDANATARRKAGQIIGRME